MTEDIAHLDIDVDAMVRQNLPLTLASGSRPWPPSAPLPYDARLDVEAVLVRPDGRAVGTIPTSALL